MYQQQFQSIPTSIQSVCDGTFLTNKMDGLRRTRAKMRTPKSFVLLSTYVRTYIDWKW